MKFSFSTLACPNYSWTDICAMTKDLGFHGIEVREIESENARSPFAPSRCEETAENLRERRIEVPCLATGCCLKFQDKAEENRKEIFKYVDVASKIGTPFIRILADDTPAPGEEVSDALILEEMQALMPYAEEKGVTLLIETNGVYADTARLRALLDRIPAITSVRFGISTIRIGIKGRARKKHSRIWVPISSMYILRILWSRMARHSIEF